MLRCYDLMLGKSRPTKFNGIIDHNLSGVRFLCMALAPFSYHSSSTLSDLSPMSNDLFEIPRRD